MARRRTLIAILVVMVAAGACRLKDQKQPSLTGPSELALSLGLSAAPDSLPRDGGSASTITVDARDAYNKPFPSLRVRLSILCADGNGAQQAVDFGKLSASEVTTNSSGKATAIYTAPSANSPLNSYCVTSMVWIRGIPIDDGNATVSNQDYANTVPRVVQIGLVPSGSTLPPFVLVPAFTATPSSPAQGETVTFDASASAPVSGIASYKWSFGDGGTASGSVVTHAYKGAKTYVATLTIKDGFGRSITLSQAITVSATTGPTAAFTFSPTDPAAGATVYFNGIPSTATPGHTIVGYNWDFGDGGGAVGAQPAHAFANPGTYTVTLLVTDDVGNTGTTSSTVTVSSANPVAAFTVTPSSPASGAVVTFDASTSTAASGSTITTYAWDFGDGNTASGASASATNTYAAAGSYTVTLTVTDDKGRTSVLTKDVSVS